MSIASRSGIALLQVIFRNKPVTGDFGSEIWDAFQKAGVQFDLIATTSREITLVVDAASLTPEFKRRPGGLAEVEVQDCRALVTLVGQNASRNSSNLARATQRLRKTPGGAILAWCSDSRFAFVVAADALNAVANLLHNEFFGQPDPDLFRSECDRKVRATDFTGEVPKEYGFTDVDGRYIGNFHRPTLRIQSASTSTAGG